MLIIQYRQVWDGATFVDWRDVGSIDVPADYSGTMNVPMPGYGQSDRLIGSSDFGADCFMKCVFHVNATRGADNAISLTGNRMDTYQFVYDSANWGGHIGSPVVKGTYDYYAIDKNSAEHFIYTYDGGNVVVANYSVDIPGFSITAVPDFHVQAQQTSNEVYYGRCYNRVNGNVVQVYLRFRNTYPADYRPGMILDGNKVWKSHNRTGGTANIRTATGWRTMRTMNGGTGTGNPPLIKHDTGYKNMRRIGAN